MRIGERVLAILQQKKMKQVDLATHLGISKSTINGWKQENRNPSSELIVPICEFLGVSERYLLTGQEEEASSLNAEILEEETQALLQSYKRLDRRGKVLVEATAYRELERVEQTNPPPSAATTEDDEPPEKPGPNRPRSSSDISKSAGPPPGNIEKRMIL